MSNPSPPKPWERAGPVASSAIMATGSSNTNNQQASSTSTSIPPPIPSRPNNLASVVNQTASNYSPYGSAGAYGATASPYGYGSTMGGMGGVGGGYSSYSSPYSRMGGMGGGYGSMYGGGYGGMSGMGGMGGMYGGGMPGMYGRMGMPGDPNNPSLTQSFSQSTQATFQLIESIVGAASGFTQMLESTFMATHSSFFAMVSVAEQFGNLKQTLGSVLGIYTLLRWIRAAIAKLTGRSPPASPKDLTPAKFAKFQGRLPDGSAAPPSPSRKPLIVFVLAVFGLPYLMGKLIKALARSQEEEQRRLVESGQLMDAPLDPSKLEFCKVLYDFSPEANANSVQGVELAVKRGELVAVLSKSDALGNPSDWWRCRSRDGRMGYLPSPYLEIFPQRTQAQITSGSQASSPAGSRAQTMTTMTTGTSAPSSRASTLTGKNVEDIVKAQPMGPSMHSKPNEISVESFQKSMFTTS